MRIKVGSCACSGAVNANKMGSAKSVSFTGRQALGLQSCYNISHSPGAIQRFVNAIQHYLMDFQCP